MKEQTAKVNNDGVQQIVVYKSSERIKMEVKTDGDTVWLTQEQMCQLFGRERSVITKHVRNVIRDGERVPEARSINSAPLTGNNACSSKMPLPRAGRRSASGGRLAPCL